MNEQKKVVPAPPTEVDVDAVLAEASKHGNLSDAKFSALLSLMMAKEARLAEKEAYLEQQLAARDEERKKESERYTIDKIVNQKNCKHLKGGASRSRGQQRDPSVYAHTFTNGDIVIKCQLCGAKWMPKDTADYLDRNGSKIPNWTGIGWREALQMAQDSSNRPSSSERFFKPADGGTQAPKDTEGVNIPNLQI
jgi:hypothetical protein